MKNNALRLEEAKAYEQPTCSVFYFNNEIDMLRASNDNGGMDKDFQPFNPESGSFV